MIVPGVEPMMTVSRRAVVHLAPSTSKDVGDP